MPERARVLEGLRHCVNLHGRRGCSECPYHTVYGDDPDCIGVLMTEACKVLEDTTNPKGGMCFTCKHESENDRGSGSTYCVNQQKCRVCGCCSGYERKDDDG